MEALLVSLDGRISIHEIYGLTPYIKIPVRHPLTEFWRDDREGISTPAFHTRTFVRVLQNRQSRIEQPVYEEVR